MNIIEKIKARRNELGFTQEKVSEMIGTSRTHYLRIESGKHSPTLNTLEKIFNALNIEIES